MAEALVKSFLQRSSSLIWLKNEGSPGLQYQIQKLKNRLEEIGSFPGEVGRSKQEDGLFFNWRDDLIETVHDTDNCINQYVAKARSQDGSDQALSIVQFGYELEKINARLAGISHRSSQPNMPLTLEAKEENGQSSSTVDVDVGKESLAPFALNYRKLPPYLRSCLLYCSLFPEKISRGRLVRLMVAEGILQERPGEVMEDTAEENIKELVAQGMLRVEIVEPWFKSELKVADPYLKICSHNRQQGKSIAGNLDLDSTFPQSSHIVWIPYRGETIMAILNDHPILSLFVIPVYSQGLIPCEYWNEGIPDDHWACVRNALYTLNFLRVLDLENLKIKSLPEEIGDLIQLRYLGLRGSALDEIPESIGNLQNLQTLDIRWPRRLRVLPNGVLNLLQLRHLKLALNEIKVPSGIGILTNLLSITGLFMRPGIIKELSRLTQLRELQLRDVSQEHASELSAAIMKMRGLLSFSVYTNGQEDDLLPTLEQFSPPPFIRKLCLDGRLTDLPDWLCSMENLTMLRLGFSFLPEEAVSVFQFLPNLKYLTLWEACKVKQINKEFCRVGGFLKLEVLIIASVNLLEWTEIEEGALPSLAFLCFHNCPRLMNLPEGLQYVTTLKVLKIFPLHPDHERRLKRDGGRENYKIKHIQRLRCFSSSLRSWVAM
ncbi:disease resistance protein RPP8-like [Macadamia integrifolia]|uniref:disease resistance protein RPP8-like n=1 Tax=Macadamia integrifolia TaxID=60698 RepID=UPI001C4F23BE|nr:disease resistance protein RPP8-like [Macadamia integrifolia]